ncbi:hypothetical protein K2X33_15360, partial [bacterium]|nr:hypothetical protein [bacterium]
QPFARAEYGFVPMDVVRLESYDEEGITIAYAAPGKGPFRRETIAFEEWTTSSATKASIQGYTETSGDLQAIVEYLGLPMDRLRTSSIGREVATEMILEQMVRQLLSVQHRQRLGYWKMLPAFAGMYAEEQKSKWLGHKVVIERMVFSHQSGAQKTEQWIGVLNSASKDELRLDTGGRIPVRALHFTLPQQGKFPVPTDWLRISLLD